MSNPWYELVSATTPISQGDLIRACPVLVWKTHADSGRLQDWSEERAADVIVMTQACDLEHF